MVYVTGDMHGDEDRLYDRQLKKLKNGDTLIICGDFGFIWEASSREAKILEELGGRKYNVCFLDGTHENFDKLYSYRQTVWKGGRVHRISGNLYHMCRGQIFNIDGVSFFTFGGGESYDKEMRTERKTWWKEELPTPEEMMEGVENLEEVGENVDVILTHEPPSLVKSSMLMRMGKIDRVNKLNGFLEEINRSCKFKQWYFGSMHEDRVITPGHISVFSELWPIIPDELGLSKPAHE